MASSATQSWTRAAWITKNQVPGKLRDDDVDGSDWVTGTRGLLHYAESTRQAKGQVGLAVLGQSFRAATCAAAHHTEERPWLRC